MRVSLLAWLAAPAVAALVAGSTGAQPAPTVVGLPAFEIVTILRSTGFEPIARPVRAPGVFFVRALDPYDAEVRVTVDARSGRILSVRSQAMAPPLYGAPVPGFARFYRAPPPYRDVYGFEDATGALPLPPRMIPPPRAPKVAQAAPMPRPRPAKAAAPPPEHAAPAAAAPAPPPAAAPAPVGSDFPPVVPLE